MKKYNFLTHLDSLKRGEVNKFDTYLKATYAKSSMLLKIYDYYASFHLKIKSPPALEQAYQKIFNKKAPSKSDIRNLQNGLSDLFLILKEYLIQKKIKETKFEKEFLWLQILEEKKLNHQRDLQFKKIEKSLASRKDIWKEMDQLQLYNHEYFRNTIEKENPHLTLIENGIRSLDDFYCSVQLKYAAELLNRKKFLSTKAGNSRLLQNLLTLFDKTDHPPGSLLNQLYYRLYQFMKKQEYKQFSLLKKFLYKHQKELSKEEQLITLTYLINFMAAQLKQGKFEFPEETFELYQYGFGKDKLLLHRQTIDHNHFRNAINVACHLKKFDWAENIIQDFHPYLDPDTQKENTSLARAMISFKKGEFSKVIQHISKTHAADIHYIISFRVYLQASKYELNQTDDLQNECESFIRYVKRSKKLSPGNKTAAIQFGRILLHLHQRKLPRKDIQKQITEAGAPYLQSWLESKLKNYKTI